MPERKHIYNVDEFRYTYIYNYIIFNYILITYKRTDSLRSNILGSYKIAPVEIETSTFERLNNPYVK